MFQLAHPRRRCHELADGIEVPMKLKMKKPMNFELELTPHECVAMPLGG